MDLTTLAAVKSYLGITTTGQDSLINSLITRESRAIERYAGRVFPTVQRIGKRLNGSGTAAQPLPDSPILSVDSLALLGRAVPVSADGVAAGYTFDDVCVYLVGGAGLFPYGPQSVTATWTAGYRESETDLVPTGNAPTLTPTTGGTALVSVSVVSAAGAAFTQVASAPAQGQYTLAGGAYAFNTADANTQVAMTYYYVPGPVEQACIEMVGLDLKQRDNLGINSKSLAGEVISYSSKGMTDSVKEMLWPYRNVGAL